MAEEIAVSQPLIQTGGEAITVPDRKRCSGEELSVFWGQVGSKAIGFWGLLHQKTQDGSVQILPQGHGVGLGILRHKGDLS
jgi:hypothetical protein